MLLVSQLDMFHLKQHSENKEKAVVCAFKNITTTGIILKVL